MTSWTDLNFIRDVLITYYFGNQEFFFAGVIILFMFAISIIGMDFKYGAIICLPLVGAFVISGVFASVTWVLPVTLLIVGLFYAYALIDLLT